MNVPCYSPSLDGILHIAGIVPFPGTQWSALLAPDGSGRHIAIAEDNLPRYVNESDPDHSPTYTAFIIQPGGTVASIMPHRAGGPMQGARWMSYALVVVPTADL